ncbi:MAG: hypothetical protein U0350_49090 [Caldilineaceae bacterium]
MLILRCTQRLRERLGHPKAEPITTPSTTVLGDWYCHLVYIGRTQLLLCVSERSLLPILLPAREAQFLPVRLSAALNIALAALNVDERAIYHELAQMQKYQIAQTTNRSVVGVLNDFSKNLGYLIDPARVLVLEAISANLAQTPCRPIGYQSPEDATRQRFAEYRQGVN